MSMDKMAAMVLEAITRHLKPDDPDKAVSPILFTFERKAGELVQASTTQALHHRGRERHYASKLEESEKELREKGVSVESSDPKYGSFSNIGHVASGSIIGGSSTLEAKIDQKLLDAVKGNRTKVVEHRDLAERYEKYARAFKCAPDKLVKLTIEDVHFFRLES